jgi:hypothetical protein
MMANYDELGICTDPIKVKDHVQAINVRYTDAESLIKQLQELIKNYGNGDITMEHFNYDDEQDVVYKTYRMETPEETKIRYDEQRAVRLRNAKQDYDRLKKIFEG